jgi:hypothetical protein
MGQSPIYKLKTACITAKEEFKKTSESRLILYHNAITNQPSSPTLEPGSSAAGAFLDLGRERHRTD